MLIGVGLNVLTRIHEAPPEVQRIAASLHTFQTASLDRSFLTGFLAAVLREFERMLHLLANDDAGLAGRWSDLNLLRGQIVHVALGPKVVAGTVQDIDADGALRLHDGKDVRCLFGGQVLRDLL